MAQPRILPVSENGSNKLPPMVGAVIYVRVSTKEQTENMSLPTQLRAVEEYCRREGYEVLERFAEHGESAKTTDRTELQKLLNYCRTHRRPREIRRGRHPGVRRTRFTKSVGLVGPGVAESEAAASAAVFPRGRRVQRKTVCSNRRNRQRVQGLDCV